MRTRLALAENLDTPGVRKDFSVYGVEDGMLSFEAGEILIGARSSFGNIGGSIRIPAKTLLDKGPGCLSHGLAEEVWSHLDDDQRQRVLDWAAAAVA